MIRLIIMMSLTLLACSNSHQGADASALDGSTTWPSDGRDAAGETDPDAGSACDPGTMRAVSCGFCGVESQRCEGNGRWEATSSCLGQGDCDAGTVVVERLPHCLERTRRCSETCAWEAWQATAPAGECERGEMREVLEGCDAGDVRTQICSDECVWLDDGSCREGCLGNGRTAPWEWAERCVPAGRFFRGLVVPGHPEVAEVTLSAYYIDQYPVTNARYRACVTAGACAEPQGLGAADYADPTKIDYPVHQIEWQDAVNFCAWDDGRRLPTEAEWEKAARGAAPDEREAPWGSAYHCDVIPFYTCGLPPDDELQHTHDAVTAFPAAASPFGVDMMLGAVRQWCSDWYQPGYYAEPSSRTDPQGPLEGTDRVVRGAARDAFRAIHERARYAPEASYPLIGFRCARDGSIP